MIAKTLRILAACLVLGAALASCQHARQSGGQALDVKGPGELRIASYNVHYIWASRESGKWSLGEWERRKGPLNATFQRLDADIVAFQEMESFAGGNDDNINYARSWLLENNPEYVAGAIGPWREFPSTQPIFYRSDRLELLDQGWFFFSDTPEEIYSRTFDGSWSAFASWADFREKDGAAPFRVVNIHTDFSSSENRRKSIALVAERISSWMAEGRRVILIGDFNARLGSELHERIEEIGLTFAPVEGATFHFDRGVHLFGAIDHIAYTDHFSPVRAPIVFREKLGDVWPTDHYPVVQDFLSP